MRLNYFTFRNDDVRCRHCDWTGKGREMNLSEISEVHSIVDYSCPKCHEDIAFVQGPALHEVAAWKHAHPDWKEE